MLTPIDIQNHVLKSTMGGYNKKETDDFIESIQVSYEQLYKENSDLKKKITTLSEGIQYYKQMEGTLQKTLVLAEQTASETLETSKTAAAQVEKESRAKADVMLAEAKARADSLVVEAQKRADALTEESETKAATLKRESEETADRLTREAQETADRLTREAQETADRLTRESQETADTLAAESRRKADAAVAEAETKADNIMRNAKERADRIMADTKASASEIINVTKTDVEKQLTEANTQLAEFAGAMKQLMSSYEDYKEQFKALLNKQLAQLEDNKYRVDVAGLEELMESQQVAVAEEQAATRQKLKDMTEHIGELELPVEDTAPEGTQPEEDILAGGLAAGEASEPSTEEAAPETTASLNIDTPSSDEIASAQGIDVSEEEAVAYKPEQDIPEETTAEAPSEDVAAKLNDIDAIAAEALKDIQVASTDPFASANSMLGTSYDDFVPAKQKEEEEGEPAEASSEETVFDDVEIPTSVVEAAEAVARSVAASADLTEASNTTTAAVEAAVATEAASDRTETAGAAEIPPTTTDELPTVQETYNAENYITSETYFGSADNMTYSIPDPKETAEEPAAIQAEEVSSTAETPAGYSIPTPDFNKAEETATAETSFHSNIPMPDFSKLDAQTAEETVPHEVPMPDFSALAATAAEAVASLKAEQPTESATVQEEYDAETYVTQETYFGSADNIPYTGTAAVTTDTDFSGGISGVDPTADGIIPSAPGELFSAPSEFDSAPPADDEYAVTGAVPEANKEEAAKVTPFTFIDAEN